MAGTPNRNVKSFASRDGLGFPLGVSRVPEEDTVNFALFSRHATGVTLLVYEEGAFSRPSARFPFHLPRNKTGDVWHLRLPSACLGAARYYAYSVAGPHDPDGGHFFDADKVLLDPHARGVIFPPGFDREAACRHGPSAGQAPLGLLPGPKPLQPARRHARRHDHDLVIYELHIRGFTRSPHSGVPEGVRGTYAGVTAKIPYLRQLGITAVELMPVFQRDPVGGSYWGYMPLNFFTPHGGYVEGGALDVGPEGAYDAFREMVDALHDAGIEVFLDVVYNHTAEDAADGPTWSYRGIDNLTYYARAPGWPFRYANRSGCGNDLNTGAPAVRQMILASAHFWVEEMGVDGFRFDLASIFSLDENGQADLSDPPVVSELSGIMHAWQARLIAEPWSGDGSLFQLGRAFPGRSWRQWNARFRDDIRHFLRGDAGCVPALMTRIYGSTDLFPDDREHAARPYQSVNYVACHDGLTLRDLFAYTNEAHLAVNSGFEGIDGAPQAVQALRRRQSRNAFCLLFLANGTPMFQAGDEFGQSHGGDPNPYDRDDETNWLDWRLVVQEAALVAFVSGLIAFRAAHPSIARSIGWGQDVTWHGIDGGEPDLRPMSRAVAWHLRGGVMDDDDLYVLVNGWNEDLDFALPEMARFDVPGEGGAAQRCWVSVIDTAHDGVDAIQTSPQPDAGAVRDMARIRVEARSIRVLLSQMVTGAR